MKRLLVISWLLFLLSGIVALYWCSELRYNLPPIPVIYTTVSRVTTIKHCWPKETNPPSPRAPLIGKWHKLYYRRNSNHSRYCIDKQTNYAKMAIKEPLAPHYQLQFNPLAVRSYGCSLPNCQK